MEFSLTWQTHVDKLNLNMFKLPKYRKSFGLVELIVALAIVVVILTLSTVGINSLRESFQLNSGTQELFNAISLARVYAENNVTYKDAGGNIKVPDGYLVEIGDNDDGSFETGVMTQNVKIKACVLKPNIPDFAGESIGGNVDCYPYIDKVIETDLTGVEIIKDTKSNIDGCARILFTVQTNEVFVIIQGLVEGGGKFGGGSTVFKNDMSCGLSVKGINSGVQTRIVVNPVNRTIKKI